MLTALAVPALLTMGAAPSLAEPTEYSTNCVLSGGGTMGQGWCPDLGDTSYLGKPRVTVQPTEEPTPVATPEPVVTQAPVVTPTVPAPTVPRATTAPNPPKVKIPPRPVAFPSTTVPRAWQTQAPKPPGITRSYGQNFVVYPVSVESPLSVPVTDWSDICHSVCVT